MHDINYLNIIINMYYELFPATVMKKTENYIKLNMKLCNFSCWLYYTNRLSYFQ